MSAQVWVVVGASGQYSDATWWGVSAWSTAEAAAAEVKRLNAWVKAKNTEDQAAIDAWCESGMEGDQPRRWCDEDLVNDDWEPREKPPGDPDGSFEFDTTYHAYALPFDCGLAKAATS